MKLRLRHCREDTSSATLKAPSMDHSQWGPGRQVPGSFASQEAEIKALKARIKILEAVPYSNNELVIVHCCCGNHAAAFPRIDPLASLPSASIRVPAFWVKYAVEMEPSVLNPVQV